MKSTSVFVSAVFLICVVLLTAPSTQAQSSSRHPLPTLVGYHFTLGNTYFLSKSKGSSEACGLVRGGRLDIISLEPGYQGESIYWYNVMYFSPPGVPFSCVDGHSFNVEASVLQKWVADSYDLSR